MNGRSGEISIRLISLAVILTLPLVFSPSGNAAGSYTFTTIDFPGATRTEPYGINNSGMIVGFHDNGYDGFVYDGNSFSSIHFPGSYFTEALGISNSGMIVGEYRDSNGNHGFLYDRNSYTTIDFPDFIYTVANGINNDGMIVGDYCSHRYGYGPHHGFLYNGSSFIKIDVPGASSTFPQGINDAGTVVGWYSASGVGNGFLYNQGSFPSFDFNFPGALYTLPFGITNSGLIAGTAFYGPGYNFKGLVYDGSSFTTIDFPGAKDTYVSGINEAGVVVGIYWNMDGSEHGFMATPVPATITVGIDIKPGGAPNSINPKSKGKIPVAILSTQGFNAVSQVDLSSLTFGPTGDELSLAFCHGAEDVDGDGLKDLVCHFYTEDTGFQCHDTVGTLKGKTKDSRPIEGTDSVKIVPCK